MKRILILLFTILLAACTAYKMSLSSYKVVLPSYKELYDSVLYKKTNLKIPSDSIEKWNCNILLTPDNDTIMQYYLWFTPYKKEHILLYINKINSDSLEYWERTVTKVEKK